MINAEDEIWFDRRTYCTLDEAVAKLLGWMRGPIHRKNIKLSESGVGADQLPFLHSLTGPIEEMLEELRDSARLAWSDAWDSKASPDDLDEKEAEVNRWTGELVKAGFFIRDIHEELAKGESSSLRIDSQAKEDSRTICLTLNSLDAWARQRYGLSIVEAPVHALVVEKISEPVVLPEHNEVTPKGGMSKTLADNLLTSFAFLVEALAESASRYRSDGEPNVLAIATRVSELAKKANGDEKLGGQSSEAIKDRVESALEVKRSKLPTKQPL